MLLITGEELLPFGGWSCWPILALVALARSRGCIPHCKVKRHQQWMHHSGGCISSSISSSGARQESVECMTVHALQYSRKLAAAADCPR